MKLNIKGLEPETRVLVGLLKESLEKSWLFKRDKNGLDLDELYEVTEVMETYLDKDHIYFNRILPKDYIIRLPNYLIGKPAMIRARLPEYHAIELQITLQEDNTIHLLQKYDEA
jgi:hypothetical protein